MGWMLRTPRLHLIQATIASLRAELAGRAHLARELDIAVPESWPPELYDEAAIRFTLDRLECEPREEWWWLYYVAELHLPHGGARLVGVAGYKGPVNAEGSVEVGYGILPEYRRQRMAYEATQALIDRAFGRAEVKRVVAETYPHLIASIAVMIPCGMSLIGEGSEEGVVRYGLTREAWEQLTAQ
jgi:RimJ/RimL family protein N-acetyltransferase